jgi:hypothetical protein
MFTVPFKIVEAFTRLLLPSHWALSKMFSSVDNFRTVRRRMQWDMVLTATAVRSTSGQRLSQEGRERRNGRFEGLAQETGRRQGRRWQQPSIEDFGWRGR